MEIEKEAANELHRVTKMQEEEVLNAGSAITKGAKSIS